MDLQGSLVDTNLIIYPSSNLLKYLKSLPINDDVPVNIIKFAKGENYEIKQKEIKGNTKTFSIHLNSKDIENLNKIKATVKVEEAEKENLENISKEDASKKDTMHVKSKDGSKEVTSNSLADYPEKSKKSKEDCNTKAKKSQEHSNDETKKSKEDCNEKTKNESSEKEVKLHLITSDIDWLYAHLQKLRNNDEKNVPYLHELLEGAQIATPENKVIKRNPVLEARCVKLRAQQEARDYRKMTKSVDNVRMRFPEDSISYQLKQVNRQLIAIGQFIISIFAGFLFGFKGLEWMIGNLDFGFRLLMGVMCALIIALAEIYFLAKKLNEELNIPETIQLGGPPKFADQQTHYAPKVSNKAIEKEHQE